VVSGGGIAGWREDTAEMYRVRMGNGETGGTYIHAREKTSLRGGTEGETGAGGRSGGREKGREGWRGGAGRGDGGGRGRKE